MVGVGKVAILIESDAATLVNDFGGEFEGFGAVLVNQIRHGAGGVNEDGEIVSRSGDLGSLGLSRKGLGEFLGNDVGGVGVAVLLSVAEMSAEEVGEVPA